MKKSIKINSILNAFRLMLTVLVPIITFRYTSHIFLADGTGKINFANAVTQSLALLANLGIYSYGLREGAKVREDRRQLSKLVKELFTMNMFATAIAYAIFFGLLSDAAIRERYLYFLLIHSINILFTGLTVDYIYGVFEDYLYITVRQIVVQVVQVALLFLLVHEYSDIYKWVGISVLCSSASNVINIIHAGKYIDILPLRTRFASVRPHIRPVLVLFATQLAGKAYTYIDTSLLGLMSSDRAVGLYSAAIKINSILIVCVTAMYPVFVPRIMEYIGNGEKGEYLSFCKRALRFIFALAVPCVAALAILSDEVIRFIADESFIQAAVTMRILTPIILLSTITAGIHSLVFVPYNKESYVLICTISTAAVNIFLSMILIPVFSENGAAVGSASAELFNVILTLVLLSRAEPGSRKLLFDPVNYIIGTCFVCVICIVVKCLVPGPFLRLLVAAAVGGSIYFCWLLLRKDAAGLEAVSFVHEKRMRL